jgi:hypothetical protein
MVQLQQPSEAVLSSLKMTTALIRWRDRMADVNASVYHAAFETPI